MSLLQASILFGGLKSGKFTEGAPEVNRTVSLPLWLPESIAKGAMCANVKAKFVAA